MRAARVLLVARLEARELLLDANAASLLAGVVLLACFAVLSSSSADPLWAAFFVGPLGLAFLAGSRRGAAHEAAFRRLVMTCPLSPAEWLWGRFVGLHVMGAAYLALVAPLVAVGTLGAREPLVALALGLVGYAGFASVLFLGALALYARGNPRAPVALAILVFLVFFTGGFPVLVHEATAGLAEAVARAIVALLPHVQLAVLARASTLGAPSWVALPAAAASLALLGALAATRYDVPRARSWLRWTALAALAGAAALAVAFDLTPGIPPSAPARATPLDGLVPILWLAAIVPAGLGAWRRARLAWARRVPMDVALEAPR